MSRVENTALARLDLLEIWLYIAEDSISAADKLTSEIDQACSRLAQFPMMGRSRDELAPNLRSFAVRSYIIFHRPKDQDIEIIRVLHGARDIESLFMEDQAQDSDVG